MTSKIIEHTLTVTSFAFNGDCSQIAVGLSNHNIEIYKYDGPQKWSKVQTLQKHIARVTGIDWAVNSNKIVSCSSDRDAYVWEMDSNGRWHPGNVVLLRINRAGVTVKWSPMENKFAVGSADRRVSVCYFENGQQAWVSKHIKKPIKSTISCLAWHPTNFLLATGSTDNHCRVFSAFIRDCDTKGQATAWGTKMNFGNCMSEYRCNGWVTAVSFDPTGNILAFAGQDSTLQLVKAGSNEPLIHYGTQMPFNCLEWANGSSKIIAAGHDRGLFGFSYDGAETITCDGKHYGNKGDRQSGGAMRAFQNMDRRGMALGANDNQIATLHVGPINDMRICAGEKGNVQKIATSSTDGRIYIWNWDDLSSKLEKLSI